MTVTANPLIVFAHPEKIRGRSAMLDSLPIGWTADDRVVNPLASGEACRLIVLDDRVPPPKGLMHGNRRRRALLPILRHFGSELNLHPERNAQLRAIGRPTIIETFSHVPGGAVFDALESLLLIGGPASAFCERFEAQVLRQALLEATMLSQIRLLAPGADLRVEEKALLAWDLPSVKTTVERKPSGWRDELITVLAKIEQLEPPP